MPHDGAATGAPRLSTTEAERRKEILGMLKDALCARRISSALVGRRSLVLRSQRGCPDYLEPARPADPQLYIFAAEAVQIVTTDGSDYQLAGGRTHPAADPGGAAQLVARYV